MRVPSSLESLTDMGIIQEVLRPLMSGKEAEVYLVLSQGEERVAKVYKEAQNRSFRQRSEYTEGRAVRNSRDQRAMAKRSKYGREQDEAAWRSTEVDMIYRLKNAGVRVPVPHHFIDGVLIMELVKDAEGNPAPRLGELALDRDEAVTVFDRLITETIRMLSAGVVHGDLSEFNVLMGADGPVVIDFPQSVDASRNQNARKLLLRDVDNLHRFVSRYVPGWQVRPLAHEMWELYSRNQLFADTKLRGSYRQSQQRANTDSVIGLIADANRDERRRREARGLDMRGMNAGAQKENPSATPTEDAMAAAANGGFRPRRVEVVIAPPAPRGGGRPAGGRPAPRVEEVEFDATRQGGGQRTKAWERPASPGHRSQPPQPGMRTPPPNAMRTQPPQPGMRTPPPNAMRTQPPQPGMRTPPPNATRTQPPQPGMRTPPPNAMRTPSPQPGMRTPPPQPGMRTQPHHVDPRASQPRHDPRHAPSHPNAPRPAANPSAAHTTPYRPQPHDRSRHEGAHGQPQQGATSTRVEGSGAADASHAGGAGAPNSSRRRRRRRRGPGSPT